MEKEQPTGELKDKKTLPKDTKRQKVREWRWWQSDSSKLVKLEQAFAIGCTDDEAILFAGISETQLYYYQRQNPEFTSRKQFLKQQPVLKARKAVVDKVDESYANAMDFLKRTRRLEFGDHLTLDSAKMEEVKKRAEKIFEEGDDK